MAEFIHKNGQWKVVYQDEDALAAIIREYWPNTKLADWKPVERKEASHDKA